jgi:hypothetical protein
MVNDRSYYRVNFPLRRRSLEVSSLPIGQSFSMSVTGAFSWPAAQKQVLAVTFRLIQPDYR